MPSKGDCSNNSARPFDVVPTISRIGGEEGREEPGCWTRVRFSPASVVAACTVYRGASVFDSGAALIKEVKGMVTIIEHKERSDSSPADWGRMGERFLFEPAIVLQNDIRCDRGVRCPQAQRRVSYKRSVNLSIRSLDINIRGLHRLEMVGQCSIGGFWLNGDLRQRQLAYLTCGW